MCEELMIMWGGLYWCNECSEDAHASGTLKCDECDNVEHRM